MVQLQTAAPVAIAKYTDQVFSPSSHTMDSTSSQHPTVCKLAVLRKVKTNKYKFFVLHKDSGIAPARLEYYESESQWIKRKKARRTIYLHTCFSINSYKSEKDNVDFGITLYYKEDHLRIAFASEQTRDMWLADMLHIISHSSLEPTYSAVQNSWSVRPHARGLKLHFEGTFKLCLNEAQASLFSTDIPQQVLTLQLTSITECHYNNNFFGLEVNHNSQTGAGEIWFELEDSLIAQHVHRAFTQNVLIASTGDDGFRPVSRSLSYKDKKAAYSTRLRSGSDARQRSGIGLLKRNQMTLSCNSFSGSQRNRSDSVSSRSTNASLSTDESDCCRRSITPDPRVEDKCLYMPLNIRNPGDSCKCLSSPSSSLSMSSDMTNSDSYADMTHASSRKPQDKNSNFVYMDMTGCHNHQHSDTEPAKVDDYVDMTARQQSPNTKGCRLRPEPVKCYLLDDESRSMNRETESTANQKPAAGRISPQIDEYVEMCRRKMLTDKSSSAPHLLPVPPYQQHQVDEDLFMNIDFDNRDRTASLSCAHRPRGSSLSQMRPQMRPRSSTTDHKLRASRMQRAHNNNLSVDYIDMTRGSLRAKDTYVEMSLDRQSRERLASIKYGPTEKEDKENHLPPHSTTHTNRVPPVTHPFPELLSASSEDDVSLHSMEGSVSLHSLTNSADSVSTSSHSSHHSNAFTSSLDMEAYVAMQPTPTSSYIKPTTHRSLQNPVRVASYILDDANERPKESNSNNHPDYMEMSPATNKRAN